MTLFRRILVPHDFSVQSGEALRIAVDLAAVHRGHVAVLHVANPPRSTLEIVLTSESRLRADLRKALVAEVARVLGKRASRVDCAVAIGDPATAIIAAAKKADSIVMSTLGRTGLAHFLVGSVAEKVVRFSRVPVLTIRPSRKPKSASRALRAPRRRR